MFPAATDEDNNLHDDDDDDDDDGDESDNFDDVTVMMQLQPFEFPSNVLIKQAFNFPLLGFRSPLHSSIEGIA